MFKFISNAIESLTIYHQTDSAIHFARRYPFEAKRRQNYLNNLIYQLILFLRNPNYAQLRLIIDDIKNCLDQDFYANDEAITNLHEDDDSFAIFLRMVLVHLHYTLRLLQHADRVRAKIKKQFSQLPIALLELTMNLDAMQSFIEDKLQIQDKITSTLNTEQERHMRGCKHLNMVYHNFLRHQGLEKKLLTHEFLYPIYFYSDPLAETEKHEVSMNQSELQKHTDCYLKQTYLNIALAVNHYHDCFKRFHNINDINAIKANIKKIQLNLNHAVKFINDVAQHIQAFKTKIELLYQEGYIKYREDYHWHKTMLKMLERKFILLNIVVDNMNQTCMPLFAYIYDESLTLKFSKQPSRLNLLLSDKPFLPIPEKFFRDAKGLINLQQRLSKNGKHTKQTVLQ